MDWIHLRDAHVSCIIGVLEQERHVPQPISIDVSLGLDLSGAANGDLRKSIDYAALASQVRFIAEEGGWRLIESLAAAILRFVLRDPGSDVSPRPVRARVKVTKPRALGGKAVPSVELRSTAKDPADRAPVAAGVRLDALVEAPEAGAYFLDLAPRASWAAPDALTMLVISGVLRAGGARFESGEQLQGGSLIATGDQSATLLAVARPALAFESLAAGTPHR